MEMQAIQINHITKKYKKNVVALDDVSLTFEFGKIYGLLGRNGAGKSTLINIISNRIFASEGSITINGMPAKENIAMHELIHCMSERDLWANLKVKEIFGWCKEFYQNFDIDKAYEIADMFNLDVNRKFQMLSTGYRSIFKLTVALALQTPYVIFDEPVLGLDANHRELFYRLLLQDYANNPRAIIIATHLIEEVANLIEEIVIIDKGKILLQESVESLLTKGYSVAGTVKDIDSYCKDKNVIDVDNLGSLKIAYILGEKEQINNDRLQFSSLNLQKLFVKLTEKGVE